ncbi:ribosomal 5S rRNA E-loop binding protein Ctc/L25/TL5 [Methylobacterium sp. 4-46]|uniref:Large ribosomal subunit protein bL25 n=1 Tax=Methylobacterium sp. (strain 4-46) TaxID=426117 RepID=RL25_METS4|nr:MULTISPECIES: 50S ribosomal protein L25/general stress protein Ctc [Methylobacterium]B0UGY1.1 RecName: Full=Large ribosomal subunit protein bL25; AltName: Full=50S ribosomal protein L25; AltName: Full=General stress protein CTC [Methylobacterium sp. 4-46]ACA16850.1 ribosomal 5S rRNA E-loop binding protein Ctc/L25/TL5 [Methylobacterium sp. 4-46]WFT82541.1 50S ribosomal protein L25/general stress protein Ctc [Methylobacterium nodulans]
MSAVKPLEAVARDRVGKGAARAVRRQGRVPAVIYGGGQSPQSISLDANQTHHLIYGGGFLSTVFEIAVDGRTIRAIPRDYQLDPVKDTPLHVDFLRVVSGQTIEVEVPVHFVNQDAAPGLKQKSGTLNVVLHTITLAVSPDAIPDAVNVDLTGKDIGDTVHVSDLVLPTGASLALAPSETVATLVPPTKLGADVEAEEAAVAEAARAGSAAEAAKEG